MPSALPGAMLITNPNTNSSQAAPLQTGNLILHPKGVEEQGWSVTELERRSGLQMCKTAGQMMSLKTLCHLCYLFLLLKADINFLSLMAACKPVVSSPQVPSAARYPRQLQLLPINFSAWLWTCCAATQMCYTSEIPVLIWVTKSSSGESMHALF